MAHEGDGAIWIEGRFTGTCQGRRRAGAGGGARRFSFELTSGAVADPVKAAPPAGDDVPPDVIRQDVVADVVLREADEQGGAVVRTLHDVRIHDWALRHPAEVGDRSFGTVVGRIHARLAPETPAVPIAPEPAGPAADTAEPPAPRRAGAGRVRARPVEGLDPDTVWRRLRWAAALAGVAVVTGVAAAACGRELAGVYGGALLAAAVVRAATRPLAARARALHGWLGVALLASQAALLAPALAAVGDGACGALPGAPLLVLAAPVLLAAWMRARWPLAATALGWTFAVCLHCGLLGPACDGGAAAPGPAAPTAADATATEASAPGASGAGSGPAAPRGSEPATRTDPSGRWPAPPGGLRFEPAPGGAGWSDDLLALGQRAWTFGTGLLALVAGAGGAPAELPAAAPFAEPGTPDLEAAPAPGEAGPETAVRIQLDAPSGPPVGVELGRPGAPPAFERLPRPQPAGRAGARELPGGWVAPDHRRAARRLTLISLEHANREPASFYRAEGRHRVYVPTDPVFEPGSARLRAGADLVLSRVAALLALPAEPPVVLEVHTDAGGSSDGQHALSARRADAVRAWLLSRGHLPPDRFAVEAHGAEQPLVPPDGSRAAQQPNRRLELRLAASPDA